MYLGLNRIAVLLLRFLYISSKIFHAVLDVLGNEVPLRVELGPERLRI
jgi:hypothetical protein